MTTCDVLNMEPLLSELKEMSRNYNNLPILFPETATVKINFRTQTIETKYE